MLLAEHLELEDVRSSLNAIAKQAEQKIESLVLSTSQDFSDEKAITENFDIYSKTRLIDGAFLNVESPEDWMHRVLCFVRVGHSEDALALLSHRGLL